MSDQVRSAGLLINASKQSEAKPTCPECKGQGGATGIACFTSGSKLFRAKCTLCGGAGVVDKATLERWIAGQAARTERLKAGRTLTQEAERLGVKPSELSAFERGKGASK